MAGALTTFAGGGVVTMDKKQMAAALLESGEAGGTGNADVLYLTFSGRGDNYKGWAIGRDREDPDPEAVYVVDPQSFIEGWTCWKAGKPAGKHEWSIYDRTQAVMSADLADHNPYADGEGWKFMMGFSMFNVDDPEQRIMFTTTTVSGRNTISDLVKEIGARILGDEPEVPVIMLDDEVFETRGQKNGKPLFPVEGWVHTGEVMKFISDGAADLDGLLAGSYASEPEEEVSPEPEPEEAKTTGRRARRARRAASK